MERLELQVWYFEIPPGNARTINIVIKAEKIGDFNAQFSGLYWPGDNKDNYQPISLTHPFKVEKPKPTQTMNPNSAAHKFHVGTGTANLNCDTCHGFPPKRDQNGNYIVENDVCYNCHTTISPTPITSIPIKTPSQSIIDSTHVSLYGEKTDVIINEDILLRLSAVNTINKPVMTVQVTLYPPSGMSITGQEFVKSGAGIYTTTYKLEPSDSKDIEIRIRPNQIGDFDMKGVIVYYFGDDKNSARTITKILSIKVSDDEYDIKNIPGFGIASVIILLLTRLIIKTKL